MKSIINLNGIMEGMIKMDKEEYREEVLQQLKEQNQRLKSIDESITAVGFLVVVFLFGLLVVSVIQMCNISTISHNIDIIRHSNDVLSPFWDLNKTLNGLKTDLDYIYEHLVGIESSLKWR